MPIAPALRTQRWRTLACAVLVVIGCVARLIWPADMEWKTDEKLMVGMAREVARTGHFPAAGMKSGGGIMNPGMSVEVFGLIALVTDDPVGMVRVVQWSNVLALLGFFALARGYVRGEEQRRWYLGLVIAAVNPLAVLFSRKIWAQDLLPLLALLLVFGHLERRRWWGAFLWGLGGALMGQVHMSGFFLAFGLLLLTLLHDRANGLRTRWIAWLAGSAVGGLTLLPWLWSLAEASGASTTTWVNIFQLNFFAYWLIDPLGIDLMYSLRDGFWTFLRAPVVAGVPTYLMAAAHLVLLLVGVGVLWDIGQRVRSALKRRRWTAGWRGYFQGMSATRLYLLALFLGLGVGMPLTGVMVYQHYLICTFPFAYIFLAHFLLRHRLRAAALLLAQLVLTVGFLWYVHHQGGVPDGDYGITYRAQQR